MSYIKQYLEQCIESGLDPDDMSAAPNAAIIRKIQEEREQQIEEEGRRWLERWYELEDSHDYEQADAPWVSFPRPIDD